MSHYRSNVRDLRFNLFEVLGTGGLLGRGRFADLDPETAATMLDEVDRLSTGPIAASYVDSDRNPPVFDPATSSVTMPESFQRSYRAYMDAEWWRLDVPVEAGGTAAPRALWWALSELIQGANAPVYMFGGGPGFGGLLHRIGTPEQQRIAEIIIERGWGGSMALTEPDAGSDVGAGTTKAVQQPDGSWHLTGVKRFITSAEHDLSDNIVHFVLARPEGAGPGTKGLSMFIVPKFRFDPVTGELGERNGVYVTNVEKKMGLKVSTTCELRFGEQQPAVAWLAGEVHDGIAQMFKVIEFARMQVGVKAIATMSTGYLNALDYARSRVQGPDLTRAADKTAPRVTIDNHPDVRRMLMLQKAYAEGMRAVYLYTADWLDQGGELSTNVNDLLLPIVKGVGSERAWEMLTLSLQTLGGSGFLQDYPMEQYLRDVKIDTLYEGTTSIQGLDFFFRKIVRDRRVAFDAVAAEIEAFLATVDGDLKAEAGAVREALADVTSMMETMLGWQSAARDHVDEVYKVGQNTTRLLLSVGDLLIGYLLTRQAAVARAALAAGSTETDFYTGKLAVARFFTATVLPELAARRAVLERTDNALMEIGTEAF
ncbi:alkylation response protein AidB-like acyl-CoA dehydrogenase [Allocatelliglobosispora scoriae]|uniref:Broad-specificity linear acyl-CoA dehydrogenase FadE5 n=1 Tax=Allocatelliglobosispora scoriae TaxID=643052 RepID=A0A841BLA6_9ACTN|nr:acyl-CoA dehydrogenase [Allocatelliglobosispora scoriae]MBB5869074.1 alkylation response protein AidB-like acyl-CoA dehydrogenase [Allocatelliglobosispora scoriae]